MFLEKFLWGNSVFPIISWSILSMEKFAEYQRTALENHKLKQSDTSPHLLEGQK